MKFSGERFVPQATEKELAIEHLQRYHSIAALLKDRVVLDAASGEGYGSFILAQHASKVIGIDVSPEAVIHAKMTYTKDNLSFIKSSIETLPLEDSSVDVVVSFETIEHVNEEVQNQFLAEIKRVLKDDGILIISTPDKHVYSDTPGYVNPFHVKEFYKEEFFQFLQSYFSYIDFYNQKFEVASVITNGKATELNRIALESWQQSDNGKYIVAVCSNIVHSEINISSVIIDNKLDFLQQRLISLQDEVEERNVHISHLDTVILEKDQQIIKKNYVKDQLAIFKEELLFAKEEIKVLLKQIELQNQSLDKTLTITNSLDQQLKVSSEKLMQSQLEISSQENQIKELQEELIAKDEIIEELNVMHSEINQHFHAYPEHMERDSVIQNQTAHIQQLIEQERRLNNILNSGGWKILTKYYKIRDMVLPDNSNRKLLAKLTYKAIKNPKQILNKINKRNLKKLKYYLSTEDPSLIEKRIDNYLQRHEELSQWNEELRPAEIMIFTDLDTSEKLVFQKTDKPLVSIIIPVYNQFHYTYACLKSILEYTNEIEFEIIIADDLSQDETVNISHYVENITIVRDDINRGFLMNCNNAARYAKGKYILFLNNDTNVQQDWLKYMVDLVENNDTIGMVGSKLVYPDGRLQEAGGIIWNDASGWNYGRLDDPEKPEYNYVKEVDYISGAAIMIRRDLWEKIGGFDERYAPAYYEDSDLAFEVRKHGYNVVFQPKSLVVHFEGISHGTDENSGIKSYQMKNKEKFNAKWKEVLQTDQFDNADHIFWARDRSKNKPTIVVVDHYVPHYDKDAGGRCTFHYLKLFKELDYHVIFIGDNFFKHEPYTSELQELGIEVLYGNWYNNNIKKWIKNNSEYIDYVYLNRPHISEKYIDIFKKNTKAKIIYFGHDLHYLRELRNYEIEKNPELLSSSKKWKEIEFDLFNKADVIHVVGSYEKEVLTKELPDKVIRNIPLYIFDKVNSRLKSFNERKDLLFVGGFNHKPNFDGINWFINNIFPNIQLQLQGIKLYIVGSNPPDDIKKLSSDNIIITGYVSDERLEQYYNEAKIVVVPLRFGAGVKGKVIEALYHQVPIVTTSIGAEGLELVQDSLIIEDNEVDFSSSVISLYNDANKWDELSNNSKNYIIKNFSKSKAISTILKDFGRIGD